MSSFPESASRLEELEAGLAALQSENYPSAIAQLSEFLASESNPDDPNAIKARIGLIRAQIQIGQSETAIALCQTLQQSRSEKARTWATQTIAKLTPVETGFVPIESSKTPRKRRVIESSKPSSQAAQPIPEKTDLPIDPPQKTSEPAYPKSTQHTWKNADRAQRWQPLRQMNPTHLQWAGLGTVAALFLTLYGVWSAAIALSWMWFDLRRLFRLSPILPDGEVPALSLVATLALAFCLSPWLLDAILKQFYRMQTFSTTAIARHSAETHRLLQRFSQQQKISIPKLGILPTQVPISFTYGCHPKLARIVVSQGLLDRLSEEEIAAIYGYELSHLAHWDFVLMSGVAVLLQIPYTLYQQCAIASDFLKTIQSSKAAKFLKILSAIVAIISAIAYGFFSLFRYSGLWLSRTRVVYRDRQVCNLTGNPNGLARALMKIAIATSETIQHEKQTHDLIESFELLSPISYRNSFTVGSLYDRVPASTMFQWEQANRNRLEILLNQSHPLLGVRLKQIMDYCQEWRINPEFEIEVVSANRKRNLLETAPLLGAIVGATIALLLWGVAYILYSRGIHQLNWLASDYSLFRAFSLLGFGLGMAIQFNQCFPESGTEQTDLITLLTQPSLSQIDSPRIRLEGTLIGRTGGKNQLGQDLILQTESGLIQLNYCSQLGAIGNLFSRFPIGQPAIVTGWFRRGATPTIDIDTIRTRSVLHSGHQTWALLIALTTILLGLLQVL
ncbi:MAG: zinc metalloprotease HtpX [Leptolyngbya sp. Prado105]|jgi:Zn-dependent protease with chaperone function|nr:zinc metalloprotease HtpX [Leptolyngbya sp. Prado105]